MLRDSTTDTARSTSARTGEWVGASASSSIAAALSGAAHLAGFHAPESIVTSVSTFAGSVIGNVTTRVLNAGVDRATSGGEGDASGGGAGSAVDIGEVLGVLRQVLQSILLASQEAVVARQKTTDVRANLTELISESVSPEVASAWVTCGQTVTHIEQGIAYLKESRYLAGEVAVRELELTSS